MWRGITLLGALDGAYSCIKCKYNESSPKIIPQIHEDHSVSAYVAVALFGSICGAISYGTPLLPYTIKNRLIKSNEK